MDNEETIRSTFDLTQTEYNGIKCFLEKEKLSCQEFAGRMGLSVSRGSRIIEKLFSHGYIDRTALSSDRRCKNIWLTPNGRTLHRKIKNNIRNCEKRITADIPDKKLDALKKELRELIDKF